MQDWPGDWSRRMPPDMSKADFLESRKMISLEICSLADRGVTTSPFVMDAWPMGKVVHLSVGLSGLGLRLVQVQNFRRDEIR